jgi:hypothetical protein
MKRATKLIQLLITALALLASLAAVARAQERGPLSPPPKFEVKKLEAKANPGIPPVPAEEIIRRLARNEDEFKGEYQKYSFQQSIRMQELADENGPAGEFNVTGEVYNKPDGQRYERIVKQPVSSLHRTEFSLEDVQALAQLPLFVLTTDQLPNYSLTYEGQEKLDELNTYIFLVKPKLLERTRLRFDGVVWVENQDFAVVKTYGKFVTDVAGEGTKLPFEMFETYRENFHDKYWFPTYIHSDDAVPQKKGELRLRLVVRDTNFQLQTAAAPPDAPSTPAAASPGKPTPPRH